MQKRFCWFVVRRAASLPDLSRLSNVLAKLPEGEKGFLGQTSQAKDWVETISRLQIRLKAVNRPILREPTAELLYKEIENFRHRVDGLHEPLATEFRAAATRWLQVAQHQLDEAGRVTSQKAVPQLFRAGDPVNREQEAFIYRDAVIGELEQQVMLKTDCPGIVLYGRRRMGKSTILRNLVGFLPNDIKVASVPMQKPSLFSSQKHFLRSITSEITNLFPRLISATTKEVNLIYVFDLLAACNTLLEKENGRLLLAIDEYEMIDKKISERIFRLDLLDTIRESIQSHRRITWVFAGSHEITELKHAAWTSYLVSARTIEVPFFTLTETRLLLTDPVKHSTLWLNNPDKRPRLDAAFWGEGGIERIHEEAGGWPHLVQLIAETIGDLINNEEQAGAVTPELMELALDKSIVRGHIVFHELMKRESTLPGEWDYLAGFRRSDSQLPPTDEKIALSLRRRMLVVEKNGDWQLRVPLMARWLKVRGQ
ncbi:MAG: AAA family ATPase [Blastocatellia bacterium]